MGRQSRCPETYKLSAPNVSPAAVTFRSPPSLSPPEREKLTSRSRRRLFFIDDGSTDGSWLVIQGLRNITMRHRAFAFGGTSARRRRSRRGFQAMTGDVVMTLDADLQDDRPSWGVFTKARHAVRRRQRLERTTARSADKVLPSKVFNWLVSALTGLKTARSQLRSQSFSGRSREGTATLRRTPPLHSVLAYARGFA